MTVGIPLQGLTGTPGVQGAEGKPGPLVSSMMPSKLEHEPYKPQCSEGQHSALTDNAVF